MVQIYIGVVLCVQLKERDRVGMTCGILARDFLMLDS